MESHFKAIECLCRIHHFIMQEHTGNPDEFAERLHISRRTLYNILEGLKDRGAYIKYDRTRRTFYYKSEFDMTITQLSLSSYPVNRE